MGTPVQVGDMVTLGEGTLDVDDVLPTRTYRVVGLVRSSYYATSSSLGTILAGQRVHPAGPLRARKRLL